jgi:phosphoserine phosphatase RsbU/P
LQQAKLSNSNKEVIYLRLEMQDLKESNDFLNIVFDSIRASIFIVDNEMIIRSLNRAGSKMLEKDEKIIIGKKCGEGFGCEYEEIEHNGCGENTVCKNCEMRINIMTSFMEKTPVTDAILDRKFKIGCEIKRKIFKYSTKYIMYQNEKMVILIINDITEEEERKERLNKQFQKIKELNVKFEEELEIAAKVQKTILPSNGEISGIKEFYAKYIPYSKVSGDYYDIFEIEDGKILLFLIDITGHGVPAALYTTFIKSALIYTVRTEKTAARILDNLNKIVAEIVIEGYYFPAIAVVIDTNKEEVSYATSSGPKLLKYRREEDIVEQIEGKGMMLGLEEEYEYGETIFKYKKGDRIYLYTDGIMALRDSKGDIENVQEEVILNITGKTKEMKVKKSIEFLIDEIKKEYGNGEYEDDITVIGVEF